MHKTVNGNHFQAPPLLIEMALPRRLQGCTHFFSFLSVLASSRNSIHPHSMRSIPRLGNRNLSSTTPPRQAKVSHGASAKAYKKLQLQPEDRAYIRKQYDETKPKRLRTQDDFLKALRAHGYVPAIDRVEEMLDVNRSPYQSKDEFDKITLGLLLSSARSANGEIRNPYKIPNCSAGQNPVRTHESNFAKPMPAHLYFLFPDDTNWHTISKYFPLPEPPRPWHPITMVGLKQDYTREEVARRLEWSLVQNAKKLRNGYNWPAPDPASYKYMEELPPPPPPVIRECNTCKKPRYLMRFWNFFVQRWQHVSAPHRPIDCSTHKKGGVGRLMYAPKGTKVGGLSPSKVEDKEWIEEEVAVKLLFRSGFIALPTVNPVLGETLARAAMNGGDDWPWIRAADVKRWAVRGGRRNGLVDLSTVTRMSKVEEARKTQQQQFLEEHAEFLDEIRETLKKYPITPEKLANIPPGQFYPPDHAAVDLWRRFEMKKVNVLRVETKAASKAKSENRKALQRKLDQVDRVLEEMKKTKAEILMIERGQGETWVNPDWVRLKTSDRAELVASGENLDHVIVSNKGHVPSPIYNRWDDKRKDEMHILETPKKLTAPSRWLDRAPGSAIAENADGVDVAVGSSAVTNVRDGQVSMASGGPPPANDSSNAAGPVDESLNERDVVEESSSGFRGFIPLPRCENERATKPPAFRATPQKTYRLYKERFRESLEARTFRLNPNIEEERAQRDRIRERLERSERRAIQREEDAFALKEAMLWSNTGGDPDAGSSESHKVGSEPKDKI